MRVCTCFLLLRIFGSYFTYTQSVALNPSKDNKRSVNLALETVLEFNEKDKASDIKFLDNVQNFIAKVKSVLGHNKNVKPDFRRDFKTPVGDTFTDFIQEVINILTTFDSKLFTDFFEILDEEIRKYHYRGCKFYELMANNEIRMFIAAKLDSMRRSPASAMKAYIDALSETLNNLNYDKNVKELIDYINSLYRQDARGKFQKVLTELELHGKSNPRSTNRLREIVKNGVRLIIFDHYTNLNTNVRRDIKHKMETFWKHFNKNRPSMDNTPNSETSEDIVYEVKKPRRHTANAGVKKSNYKNRGKEQNGVKHDNKRKKLTRKDTKDGPSSRSLPSSKTKHQEQSDSLSSESIEVYHQSNEETRQTKTTKSNKILKKTAKNSRKKTEKLEVMNQATRNPKQKTLSNILIEESTGRLPKAVLDKLSMKARALHTTKAASKYASDRNKKYNKGQKRWHGKMYELKDDTKRQSKYESREYSRKDSDENKKIKTFRSSKSFNSKQHLYKKSMGTMRAELNRTDRSSRDPTKKLKYLDVVDVLKLPANSGEGTKRSRGSAGAKKQANPPKTKRIKYDEIRRMKVTQQPSTGLEQQKSLSKKKKMLSRKFESQIVESLEHSPLSSMSVEKMDINTDKKFEYQSKHNVTSSEQELYFVRKIKKLEREIEEVKSQIKDKAEEKLSESKEKKEMRPETKIGSDVENDPKIGNLEAAGTLGNKTATSVSHDEKDTSKNEKINNNIETNHVKRKLFQAAPGAVVNRSNSDYIPSQQKVEMPKSAFSKTKPITENKYVHNLVSKYKKLMENYEKGKSKIKVNAGLRYVKNNISDFTVIGTPKTTKEVLIDSVRDKDSKIINDGKKEPSHSLETKDKAKVKNVANYQKDIIEKDKDSKYKQIDDGSLNVTKTANNNKEVFNKSVSVKNFEGMDKDKKPKAVFRSDVNLINNNFKDIVEVPKVTGIAHKEIADNEIKTNEGNEKRKQVEAKLRPLDNSFTTPHVEALHNTGNEDKTDFTTKTAYASNLDTTKSDDAVQDSKVNDVPDKTENPKIDKIDSQTVLIEKDKNSNTKPKSNVIDFQSITATKRPIIQGVKKTEGTLNIVSVSPEVNREDTGMMKFRAFDDVIEGTGAENRGTQPPSTPTIATEAATRAATTQVISSTTVKLSTMQPFSPGALPSEFPL